ncbi:MAG: hypothetical protein AAFQ94_15525 [Bacteroidota bacterium]
MTRITNKSDEYIKEVRKLLTSDFSKDLTIHWVYLEFAQLMNYGLSMSFGVGDNWKTRKLIIRKWNGISHNQLGIYHLDKIQIHEETSNLMLIEANEIQQLLKKANTEEGNGLVLDGIDYELTDLKENQTWRWKQESQLNPEFRQITEILKNNSGI